MESNVLVVVEGNKTESRFFKRIAEVFDQKFDVYCLGTNIYSLYKRMKDIDFNGNLKDVLAEIHPDQKDILSKKFAYTYLIFDCDAHHTKKDETRSIGEIVLHNIQKLGEMAEYFIDETDPTIGKLYINYPMMESYRDCDEFFENKYAEAGVSITDLPNYKKHVSTRKICRFHVDQYTKEQFVLLILQNIYKLNKIYNDSWDKLNYEEYRKCSDTSNILSMQKKLIKSTGLISVINTSLFMITDFYGNKDGFYDSLNL